MYHKYQTKGFVLSSVPRGEANENYILFTKNMGLIHASAQGVRFGKSKLKGALDDFKHVEFSLVKGREFWRITGASEEEGVMPISKKDSLCSFARIASLLRRLIHGEENNDYLYDVIDSGFRMFSSKTDMSFENTKSLEALMVLKILYAQGYVKSEGVIEPFVLSSCIKDDDVPLFKKARSKALVAINEALKQSQL